MTTIGPELFEIIGLTKIDTDDGQTDRQTETADLFFSSLGADGLDYNTSIAHARESKTVWKICFVIISFH